MGASFKLFTSCEGDVQLNTGQVLALDGFPAQLRVAGDDLNCPYGFITLPPGTSRPPSDPCGDLCANGERPQAMYLRATSVGTPGSYVEFVKPSPINLLPDVLVGSGLLIEGAVFQLRDRRLLCSILPRQRQFDVGDVFSCDLSPRIQVRVWDDENRGRLIARRTWDTSCNVPILGGYELSLADGSSLQLLGESENCAPIVTRAPTPRPTPPPSPEPCLLCRRGQRPGRLYILYEAGPGGYVQFESRSTSVLARGILQQNRVFTLEDDSDQLSALLRLRVWTSATRRQLDGESTLSTQCPTAGGEGIRAGMLIMLEGTEHVFRVIGDSLSCTPDVTTTTAPVTTASTTTTTTTAATVATTDDVSPPPGPPRSDNNQLDGGAVFGVVLAVLLLAGAATAAIVFAMRYVRGEGAQSAVAERHVNPLNSEPEVEEGVEVNDLL